MRIKRLDSSKIRTIPSGVINLDGNTTVLFNGKKYSLTPKKLEDGTIVLALEEEK